MASSTSAAPSAAPKNYLMTEMPAEIRNEIFAFAQVNVDTNTGERKTISMGSLLLRHKAILNKMLVSKQYRAEAAAIFWGSNIFQIEQSGVVNLSNSKIAPDGTVTKHKHNFFKGVAHGTSLQVKIFGQYQSRHDPFVPSLKKPDHGYAVLLPPKQCIKLIKEIVLVIPVADFYPAHVTGDEEINKAISCAGTNVGSASWLWPVCKLKELGFVDMETVTFRFDEAGLSVEKKEAIKKFVEESEIDAKQVNVVFKRI